MRTGASNCAVQQTLTTEAASVLKHSLSLARRRGHAQVTPLHVAAILLTSRVSLLRKACLKSQPNHIATSHHHHHPLQCRALELCFNVALNRLPTSPGPLLHGQPCLSNALIAALKRAQAHQRRGCIEQQQQQPPLLAIKVELEQLILSILDDPSVSRVMREAGFSSTAIKSNIEESASSVSSVFQCYNSSPAGIYSTPNSPPNYSENPTSNSFWNNSQNPLLFSPHKYNQINTANSSDIKLVIDVLVRSSNNKRRNAVIVGDSASSTGGLVTELMGKVERGDVPEELKGSHFIKFQFTAAPLMLMKREEVELNISDLKRKVESLTASSRRGVIIYTGDLKWTVDSLADQRGGLSMSNKDYSTTFVNYYSPVDHLVAEIGRLVSSYNNSSSNNAKVWLVATANYQTYMKCQMKQPPLDIQWSLQAISVPSGGLGLSLNSTSAREPRIPFSQQIFEKKPVPSKEEQDALSCCAECTSNYEREARLKCGQQKTSALYSTITCDTKDSDKGPSLLPDWLKPHDIDTTNKDDLAELKRKWSSLCQNLHQGKSNQSQISSVLCNEYNSSGKNYSFNSLYPWWPKQNSIITECKSISFCDAPSLKPNQGASTVPRFRRQQSCHIEFSFSNGNNQSVEPNLDSLKIREGKEVKITLALGNSKLSNNGSTLGEEMLKMLQENLPWQMENMHTILDALMDFSTIKNWLLIQGNDSIGKQRLARVIAKSVFGSADLILCINMRKRENTNHHVELLNKSLRNNEKLVVLVEDVDFADSELLKFLMDAYENGSSSHLFILARTSDNLTDGREYYTESVIQMKLLVSVNPGSVCIDHKRKLAEWELSLPNKTKSPRNNVMEDVSSITARNGKMKKEFTRQLSSNALDLNIKVDEEEEDENEAKTDDFSPISSDLTRDTANDQHHNNPPLGFLDHIKNRLVLNRDSSQEKQMREVFVFKMRRSMEEVCGSKILDSFCLEEMVMEKVFEGCGSFLNSLFDEWLKDIFQTSLQMVDNMDKLKEKENGIIKLCLVGGKDESGLKDGFKGSCLPRGIQVSFVD